MRTLSIFIAASLDGYIATADEDLSFLKSVEKEGEDYGYRDFIINVDTIIVGRKTYDWVCREMGSSHYDNGKRKVYVITRTPRPDVGSVQFYTGSLPELIKQLKVSDGKNIYCDGGSEIIHELLKNDLIDEFIISVIPVLLGNGIRLFKDERTELQLELIKAQSYDTGLVQLHYKRNRNN